MSMYGRRVSSANRVVLPIYQQLDKGLKEVMSNKSCSEGCDSCCHILAVATVSEMLVALAYLGMSTSVLSELKARNDGVLLDHMIPMTQTEGGLRSKEWRELGVPCVFLKDHKCSIYPVRPVVCRAHAVSSDPKLCRGYGKQVSIIDVRGIDSVASDLILAGEKMPFMAPIPAVLRAALNLVNEGVEPTMHEVGFWIQAMEKEVFAEANSQLFADRSSIHTSGKERKEGVLVVITADSSKVDEHMREIAERMNVEVEVQLSMDVRQVARILDLTYKQYLGLGRVEQVREDCFTVVSEITGEQRVLNCRFYGVKL